LRRTLLLTTLVAACWAGEGAVLRVSLADGVALQAHWSASLLGRAYAEPALLPIRARVDAWLAQQRGGGLDPVAAVRMARSAQLRFYGIDERRESRWAVQANLGVQAPALARRVVQAHSFPRPADLPAADQAWVLDGRVLANYGGILACGSPAGILPLPPAQATADLDLDLDLAAMATVAHVDQPTPSQQLAATAFDLLATCGQTLSLRADLAPDGFSWRAVLRGDAAVTRPVDRSLLARLPTNASAVLLVGVDGPAWWRASGAALLAAMTADQTDARAAFRAICGFDLQDLIEACTGTIAVAQTPGVPYPGISVLLPRSPRLDRVMADLCRGLGCAVPQGETFALLPIPDAVVQVQLSCTAEHWIATTDALLAATWHGSSGFDTTEMGRRLSEGAPQGACVLGVYDLRVTLRMLLGQLNAQLALNRELSAPEKQAVLAGLAHLAVVVPPGYLWAVAQPQRVELTGSGGDVLWLVVPAAAAAILPDVLESRSAANEAAAIVTLKTGIFAAEVQFQGGGYQDQDADGVGEYGLLSELSGRRATDKLQAGKVHLLSGALNRGDTSHGYRFAVYLPDGRGGAIGEPDGAEPRPSIVDGADVLDADAQERAFVVYAWPDASGDGQRVFAMDQSGQIRERPWDGQTPRWNSLFGDGTWTDEPAWPPLKRGARRR
jgi:hypothetical protein